MKFIIEHLSKHYEKKEVLRDIDFTFEEGKIYGLLGRNGAGKTTIFRMMTALPPAASMVEMAVTSWITGAVKLMAERALVPIRFETNRPSTIV